MGEVGVEENTAMEENREGFVGMVERDLVVWSGPEMFGPHRMPEEGGMYQRSKKRPADKEFLNFCHTVIKIV